MCVCVCVLRVYKCINIYIQCGILDFVMLPTDIAYKNSHPPLMNLNGCNAIGYGSRAAIFLQILQLQLLQVNTVGLLLRPRR